MQSPENRWQTILNIWQTTTGLYALAGFFAGIMFFPLLTIVIRDITELLTGLVPEAIGIGFTVTIIDALNRARDRRREERQLQERLVREAGSSVPSVAKRAVEELAAHGWLKGENGLLSGANLRYADLTGADLKEANLSGADLFKANLTGAKLQKANLSGAKLNLADLSHTKLGEANMRQANLDGIKLTGAFLGKTDLSGANLYNVDLSGMYLAGDDLSGANLEGANLSSTKLRYVKLMGANLEGADLSRAHLQNVDLSGADLPFAKLSGASFENVVCDENTTLPDNSTWIQKADWFRFMVTLSQSEMGELFAEKQQPEDND